MKAINKLITIVLVLLFTGAISILVPTVFAYTNAIGNPGFEASTAWTAQYSSFLGSYAKVQDGTYKHSGNYSGLTQTNNPKQEFCTASLYQQLNSRVNRLGEFYYWIRKGSSAYNGYSFGEVSIYLTGSYALTYYHGFDGSAAPSGSGTHAYIDVGNTALNTWAQIYRNLRNDLVDKFGASIIDRNVTRIELLSDGFKELDTGRTYGQRVNWDDVWMDGDHIYTAIVTLSSSTSENETNVGSITFAGDNYTLPTQVQKESGSYEVTANPPKGYYFVRWETSGDVTILNSTSQTTSVIVLDDGTLNAVFQFSSWTFMVYMCADNGGDLDDAMIQGINGMEMIGSTKDVTVLAQLDRCDYDGWPYPNRNRYYECRYLIKKDSNPNQITSPIIWKVAEVNMADPQTLVDFVECGIQNYPAKHYAVVLSDHGNGFQYVCIDMQDDLLEPYISYDEINMTELKWAFGKISNDTGVTVDLLGFDACLMAQMEVAYQLRGLVKVFVGSEETESIVGWPYKWIIGNLTANPTMNPQQLGSQIVTSYGNFYGDPNYAPEPVDSAIDTLSATDMSGIADTAQSLSDVGAWLSANLETVRPYVDWARQNVYEYPKYPGFAGFDYVDAYDLMQLLKLNISDVGFQQKCNAVMANIENIVFANWAGTNATDSHGLHIYFQNDANYYLSAKYDVLDMSTAETGYWDDFVRDYLGI